MLSFSFFFFSIQQFWIEKIDEDENEDEEEEIIYREAKNALRPSSRPMTIIDSPPVRSPQQGEVAQLTAQFNRMSVLMLNEYFFSFLLTFFCFFLN